MKGKFGRGKPTGKANSAMKSKATLMRVNGKRMLLLDMGNKFGLVHHNTKVIL